MSHINIITNFYSDTSLLIGFGKIYQDPDVQRHVMSGDIYLMNETVKII